MQKIFLSRKDRKLAGVIGGVGESLALDPTLLRLLVVFLALVTGVVPALLTYLIAWLIIPREPKVTVDYDEDTESGGGAFRSY